jgi:glycosyltransferase involved in cell wall biosynthesis
MSPSSNAASDKERDIKEPSPLCPYPNVIALIPAHNEATAIAATVKAIREIPGITRILVVDDGSTDDTAALAEQAGASVLRLARNSGKGAALQQGVEALADGHRATQRDGSFVSSKEPSLCVDPAVPDVVLLLDGDLGASAHEAQSLLHPVIEGLADMTIGVLPKPPESGGFGVVKDLARGAIRELGGGYDAQAPLSGQRALSWECLQAVLPFAEGYGVEVALTIRALQQHYRVLEVIVNMQHRATGRDLPGFLHRARQYLDVRRTITRLTHSR